MGSNLLTAAAVCVPWALGCFSTNSAQQARLVALAPALAGGSVALYSAGMYAGQALGAAGGGWAVAQGGMQHLHWAGFAAVAAAMLASARATHHSAGRNGVNAGIASPASRDR